jgi:Holliday junction DNA helicase RuvA
MIAFVKGKLIVKEPSYVIVDVNGVGYHVRVSLNTYSLIGADSEIILHTHLHVKEDAHTLYGFYEEEERQIFQQLISISGVGPNTALMLLSSLKSEELKAAIVNGQVNVIQSVKGIGGKTAQRIILELKDKLPDDVLSETEIKSSGSGNTLKNEALSALLTLGYTKAAAEKAIDKVMREQGGNIQLEDLIKFVLKSA